MRDPRTSDEFQRIRDVFDSGPGTVIALVLLVLVALVFLVQAVAG